MSKEWSIQVVLENAQKATEIILDYTSAILCGVHPKLISENKRIETLLKKISKNEITDPNIIKSILQESKTLDDQITKHIL